MNKFYLLFIILFVMALTILICALSREKGLAQYPDCPVCEGVGKIPGRLWGTNPCKSCDGSGKVFQTKPCDTCKGARFIVVQQIKTMPEQNAQQIDCPVCKGIGEIPGRLWGTNPCESCDGKGKVPATKCSDCDAKGFFIIQKLPPICPWCSGNGKFPGVLWDSTCDGCNGKGVVKSIIKCKGCDGNGTIKVGPAIGPVKFPDKHDSCKGTGKVVIPLPE